MELSEPVTRVAHAIELSKQKEKKFSFLHI